MNLSHTIWVRPGLAGHDFVAANKWEPEVACLYVISISLDKHVPIQELG